MGPLLILVLLALPLPAYSFDHNYTPYKEVLKEYVSESGPASTVDYNALKKNPKNLNQYLAEVEGLSKLEFDNFSKDEKMGGTVHMALGSGYPETGNSNKSGVHWDMICDLRSNGKVLVDDELLMENGKLVPKELQPLNDL